MEYQAPAPTGRPNSPYTATYKDFLAADFSRPYKIFFSHPIPSTGPLYFGWSGGEFIVLIRSPVVVSLRLTQYALCHPSLDSSSTANVQLL
jgi:hypothetical protein